MKRVSIPIEDDLFDALTEHVPHGFRRHLINRLLKLAVNAVKNDGQIMLGALIAGEYKLVRHDPNKEAA